MLQIERPATKAELDQIRSLMRAFIEWHFDRHAEDIDLVKAYFDDKAFEQELATLPGKYAPPDGCLLLATANCRPAGCVALRRIDATSCEMKRMFVYTEYHGMGVGVALANAIIQEAKSLGYERMLLDTGARQKEAKGLYHRMGFKDVPPYYDLPPNLSTWLTFMELDLRV